MTANFKKIKGVGKSREQKLQANGYETFSELAEADAESLSESMTRLPEDSALEIIVQAQNMAELESSSITENPDVGTDLAESREQRAESGAASTQNSSESGEESRGRTADRYTVEISLDTGRTYDTMYDTLISHRKDLIRTNQPGTDRIDDYLDELRELSVGDTLELHLTPDEITDFHNIVREHRVRYQGKGFQEHFEAFQSIEEEFETQREAYT